MTTKIDRFAAAHREWSRRLALPGVEVRHMPFNAGRSTTTVLTLRGRELGTRTVTGKGSRERIAYHLPLIEEEVTR